MDPQCHFTLMLGLVVFLLLLNNGASQVKKDQEPTSILGIVAAYASKDNEYLQKVVQNYLEICEGGYTVKLLIHTTDFWSAMDIELLQRNYTCIRTGSNKWIQFDYFDKSVKLHLTKKHRSSMEKEFLNHDLFIYQEDDIGITLDHIRLFLRHTHRIQSNFPDDVDAPIVGFLRYEEIHVATTWIDGDVRIHNPNGGKFLIEMPLQLFGIRCIDDVPYVVDTVNPHQASFLLTQRQVWALHRKCNFFKQPEIILNEDRGTMVYMSSFSVRFVFAKTIVCSLSWRTFLSLLIVIGLVHFDLVSHFVHSNFSRFTFDVFVCSHTQLFKTDPRILPLVGLQSNISCDMEKVIPAADFLSFGVHHMRQRYAAGFPVATIHDAYADILHFASDPSARSAGSVPQCWQDAVDTGSLAMPQQAVG